MPASNNPVNNLCCKYYPRVPIPYPATPRYYRPVSTAAPICGAAAAAALTPPVTALYADTPAFNNTGAYCKPVKRAPNPNPKKAIELIYNINQVLLNDFGSYGTVFLGPP